MILFNTGIFNNIVNLSVVLCWEDLYIQSIFSMEAYFMHLSVALCSWEDLHIH